MEIEAGRLDAAAFSKVVNAVIGILQKAVKARKTK
jgi:hypothetical protein